MATPADRLYDIVEQGLCIGCGICQSIAGEDSVLVRKGASGYLRPVVVGPLSNSTVDTIYDVCPGTRVDGGSDSTANQDLIWGPWHRITRGWASNPDVRFEGSTGGVLTALGQYLLSSERVDFVLHAKASVSEPTFGEPTLSFTEAEVLGAAGSRYGPTPTLIDVSAVLDRGRPFAFIGTPCDVSALRNWARHDTRVDELVGYMLTMVCGGFGTPDFTNRFLTDRGIHPGELISLRYRGRGCPGPTRAESPSKVVEAHYLDFWGEDETMWTLPWRCKICPDGIGEAADLAVSDTWPGGSPDRLESETDPGVNAIVARTTAGLELMEAAARDGAITLESDITPEDMSVYQPHQKNKKEALGGRFAGLADEGRLVPITERLRIDEITKSVPVEITERQRAGARERIAAGKATEERTWHS